MMLILVTAGAQEDDPYSRISRKIQEIAPIGLTALSKLVQHQESSGLDLNSQDLITICAFADGKETWSTEQTTALATDILRECLSKNSEEAFAIETILKGYLRPLFSKSRPATVTESGRKAEYLDSDGKRGLPDETRRTKPWKYQDLRAIPAFSWVVDSADVSISSV
jgi:hypothetical protein